MSNWARTREQGCALALLLLLGSVTTGSAQIRASERGTVSQLVDGTTITVAYGRPHARGRTLFGKVVHWGDVWTPGANWATTIRFSKSVRLAGRDVPEGEYSVWIVPGQDRWTLNLHRQPKRYHLERPKPEEMLLSVEVMPYERAGVEMLTFDFPEVDRDRTTLRFQWGTTALDVPIEVSATAGSRPGISPSLAAPYLGDYMAEAFGERDTVRMQLRIGYESGRLTGTVAGRAWTFELIPTGALHQFLFEWHDERGPFDVELDSPVIFDLDSSGRATGYRMKGIEQPLWMRAVRTK
ncbi:MAG: DUF2911 domain-containing protein [Gemmatimonadota bacterium]